MSVSPVDERSTCTRFNGATTPKTKPPGNVKIIFNENFPSYSTLSYGISGRDSFKGGRSVTAHFLLCTFSSINALFRGNKNF
jgi:hypothetical protein